MQYDLPINITSNTDLVVYLCGTQKCESLHSYGPVLRDHYIFHYIINGKGIFKVHGITYKLEKNMGFLICPGELAYYQADKDEPWEYSWVGFKGLKADIYVKEAGFSKYNSAFTYDKDEFILNCFKDMIDCYKYNESREVRLVGYLYLFLGQLIEFSAPKKNITDGTKRREGYLIKAMQYIQMNYYRDINISILSKYLGLDRSYLYIIFKQYLKISPKEYLSKIRLEKAEELMKSTELLIGEIARSVGYDDQLLFSKIFKKNKGISPKKFIEEIKSQIKHNTNTYT
jgi:AraC-like DNA-binding protein